MIATRQPTRMRTNTTTMKTRLLRTALIALLLAPTAALAQTEEVVFYHTDAIGSVRMITDATGAVLARYDFAPFGEKWDPQPDPDRLQFAGKERDTETGLDYFGARYYRTESGRFLSVDPELGLEIGLIDPQRWNRYSYVGNRPTRLIDHDGRSWSTLFRIGKAIVKGEDLYAAASGVREEVSTIFSMDARVGTGDRMWATGRLVFNISGLGDVPGIKGIGSFAMRHMDDASTVKAINLPAWRKVEVDMTEVLSGHTSSGARAMQSGIKSLFPDTMNPAQIENAVRQAYRGGSKVRTQGDRVQIRGPWQGGTIEMWVNVKTKTIETAYPLF